MIEGAPSITTLEQAIAQAESNCNSAATILDEAMSKVFDSTHLRGAVYARELTSVVDDIMNLLNKGEIE